MNPLENLVAAAQSGVEVIKEIVNPTTEVVETPIESTIESVEPTQEEVQN